MAVTAIATHCTIDRTPLRLRTEHFDKIDNVFVGELECPQCARRYLDCRRAEQLRPGQSAPPDSTPKGSPMAKKAPAKPATRAAKPKPKSQPLPGLENRAIAELEQVAVAYAEIRDERMALNVREQELKANALKLMRQHDRMVYKRDGIEIVRVPGEEDVKVRVKKHGEDENEADE